MKNENKILNLNYFPKELIAHKNLGSHQSRAFLSRMVLFGFHMAICWRGEQNGTPGRAGPFTREQLKMCCVISCICSSLQLFLV